MGLKTSDNNNVQRRRRRRVYTRVSILPIYIYIFRDRVDNNNNNRIGGGRRRGR